MNEKVQRPKMTKGGDSLNKDETENSYKEVNEKDRDDESEENTDDDDELKKGTMVL